MSGMFLGLVVIILVALAFDYTNGFHDAANAIAIAVSTKALTPRAAVPVTQDSLTAMVCTTSARCSNASAASSNCSTTSLVFSTSRASPPGSNRWARMRR